MMLLLLRNLANDLNFCSLKQILDIDSAERSSQKHCPFKLNGKFLYLASIAIEAGLTSAKCQDLNPDDAAFIINTTNVLWKAQGLHCNNQKAYHRIRKTAERNIPGVSLQASGIVAHVFQA